MKTILVSTFICISAAVMAQTHQPVKIIFDTDIAPDYDDVGAMALLHSFADNGEAAILATVTCNAFGTTVPTLSVLNTYFNRPAIPIGVTKNKTPDKGCSQLWAEAIVAKYAHNVRTNEEAMDAVQLYRRILSAQPDSSITVVSVGFFTNLAGLLNSAPDNYSPLNGKELVKKKVKQLVSMAARLDTAQNGGYEFNVVVDAAASKQVFEQWPTPIIISGFEIGEKILTGIRLIKNESIQNSPVKDAYKIALAKDSNTIGRNSWDQTAVLVAVRGLSPWFGYRKVNFTVQPDGKNELIPGDRFTCLTFNKSPEEIALVIEDLMMHQPAKK